MLKHSRSCMNKFQVSALAREAKEMQGVRAKKEEKPAEGMIWVTYTLKRIHPPPADIDRDDFYKLFS